MSQLEIRVRPAATHLQARQPDWNQYPFILEWTTSLDSSSGSLFARMCIVPMSTDLCYYVIRDVIVF